MISRATTLPPGSTLIFAVEVDTLGNETYVGPPMVVGGHVGPATYNTPPNPRATTPVDVRTLGGRNLDVTAREGLRLGEAAPNMVRVYPNVMTGWSASRAAGQSDDTYAYTQAVAGVYCDALELSSFNMSSLPADATITGIKVTVERSKI